MRKDIGLEAMKTGLLVAGLTAVLFWIKSEPSESRPIYAMAVGEESDYEPIIHQGNR